MNCLNRDRANGNVDRQLGFKPRAPAEMKPQPVRPAEHQIEIHSQPVGWQNLFKKPVPVARHDNENSLFYLGLDAVLLISEVEIRLSYDAELLGFESSPGSTPDASDAAFFFRQT